MRMIHPYEDDLVVISVVLMAFNVKHILVGRGSSMNVLYWDTFIGLNIPKNLLQPYHGALVGFARE